MQAWNNGIERLFYLVFYSSRTFRVAQYTEGELGLCRAEIFPARVGPRQNAHSKNSVRAETDRKIYGPGQKGQIIFLVNTGQNGPKKIMAEPIGTKYQKYLLELY